MSKILVITGRNPILGAAYHRVVAPFEDLQRNADANFEIDFGIDLIGYTYADLIHYNIIVVHRLITAIPSFYHTVAERISQLPNTKLVVDIDDYWQLEPNHPNAEAWQIADTSNQIQASLKLAHQVWTTTDTLANALRKQLKLKNVTVTPNAINGTLEQWQKAKTKTPSEILRIGVFCQPTHMENIVRLQKGIKRMHSKFKEPWELVCIGVPPSRENHVAQAVGMPRMDVVFRPRIPVTDYATHYKHIDVLLAPLKHSKFNQYRSALKLAECQATNTPVIAENWGPYKGMHPALVNAWDGLPKRLEDEKHFRFTGNIPTWKDAQHIRIQNLVDICK